MNHSRWHLLPPIPDQRLANHPDFSPLIVQLLYNRGLTEPSQWQSFIAGDESQFNDPFLLPGIAQAVTRIYRALLSGEKIAIYGDFDADGISATALLVEGLSRLGSEAIPYIPHRLTEGYGLKKAALEGLYRQGVSLVITVDCGITSSAEIKAAARMGLDVIVTDHHTPLPEIPPAVAIVNPKMPDSTYPFRELAGVGVALKLLQALLQNLGKEEYLAGLMDLVALGTIADISPLLGENRYLVKEGLRQINASPRLGLNAMITQAGLNPGSISAENISWTIAPRLNAAGRLEHAIFGYKLLMTDSPREADELAVWLDQKNTERQKLTSTFLTRAREQILTEGVSSLLFAGDHDYPLGIAGLVAGKLSEEFYRPVIITRTGEKTTSGSGRSIPEFNIIAALTQCRHLLSQFGGHSQAAGFTLPTRNLASLQQTLRRIADEQLAGADLRRRLDIDAAVTLPDLGGDTFQMTQLLAPFGKGNPLPIFLSRRVEVISCRTMGNGDEHLRLKLRQDGSVWDGVAFRLGSYIAEITSHLDIVYNLEIDRWKGAERLRLNILDFAQST